MTEPLSDERLKELQGLGGRRAAADPAVLALLTDVVARYPRGKIHWLTDAPEAIRNDWYAKRLHRGRLAGMIDQAGSVVHLRRLASGDLYQYAVDERRPELSARLFERVDAVLRSDPDRFMVMMPASDRGATCWTLTPRPASAMFSDRDPELKSLVWAVGLNTLEEKPGAKRQTQFIGPDELGRYVYEMLERSARGFTLDQLARGLAVTYGLDQSLEELPDEALLADRHYAAERAGVPMSDPPALPTDEYTEVAGEVIRALTDRQRKVLKLLREQYTLREIAEHIGCAPGTVSADRDAIAAVLSGLSNGEDLHEILSATMTLLFGDDNEL
jgi:DNA-binding CsgD family transcriptional regulator